MAGSQGMTSIYKKGTSVYRGECRSHKRPAHTRGADPCLSRANYNKKRGNLTKIGKEKSKMATLRPILVAYVFAYLSKSTTGLSS